MIQRPELVAQVGPFLSRYNQNKASATWQQHSSAFHSFWTGRIMAPGIAPISDHDCDLIIRILDRNGSGNTKGCEAVARAMVPQGAWRRMFNELHATRTLGSAVDAVLNASNAESRADAIDQLYAINADTRNNLTGKSGNAIGAMLAAWEPSKNLSMISLRDRASVINYLGLDLPLDWDTASVGTRIAASNDAIMAAGRQLGLPANARTISVFFYEPQVKHLWRPQHVVTLPDRSLHVSVPPPDEEEEAPLTEAVNDEVRESMQVQALLAKIGAAMGFSIWLPRNDRSRVLKAWTPMHGQLLESLPLAFDSTTIATIEQIDVLWIHRRAIVRAFEVEHTTAIYSGLLRMADLVALQPKLDIRLHIVADEHRREKVMREIKRPVFTLLEGGALQDKCTYLSYDKIRELSASPHLEHLSETVLTKYEESAQGGEDDL